MSSDVGMYPVEELPPPPFAIILQYAVVVLKLVKKGLRTNKKSCQILLQECLIHMHCNEMKVGMK